MPTQWDAFDPDKATKIVENIQTRQRAKSVRSREVTKYEPAISFDKLLDEIRKIFKGFSFSQSFEKGIYSTKCILKFKTEDFTLNNIKNAVTQIGNQIISLNSREFPFLKNLIPLCIVDKSTANDEYKRYYIGYDIDRKKPAFEQLQFFIEDLTSVTSQVILQNPTGNIVKPFDFYIEEPVFLMLNNPLTKETIKHAVFSNLDQKSSITVKSQFIDFKVRPHEKKLVVDIIINR